MILIKPKFALPNLSVSTLRSARYKKDGKKDNFECILYIQCQHFINIVQQLRQNNFENCFIILCSHLWKVLCPQSVLFLEEVK